MTNLLVIKTISYLLCLYSLLPIQSQTHNIVIDQQITWKRQNAGMQLTFDVSKNLTTPCNLQIAFQRVALTRIYLTELFKICFCFVLGLREWMWGMELDFGDVGTQCI